jgi:hypothetical protein
MARHTVTHHWFVSVEVPKPLRRVSRSTPARQTKTFPTETEAKQFAKEMLSNKYKIVAGTLLGADQPARRIISGSQLYRWIEEEDAGGHSGKRPIPRLAKEKRFGFGPNLSES